MTTPVTYGTKYTGTNATTVGSNDTAEEGAIYQATYSISGWATSIPFVNWQQDAINNIETGITNNGGQLVYLNLDPDNNTIFVQWTYPSTSSTSMEARVIPLIVIYAIAIVIIALVAVWVVVTLEGEVEKFSWICK